MKNKFSKEDLSRFVNYFVEKGFSEDVATCVYFTRLIGNDQDLVLHGGGNTSVKTKTSDLFGDEIDILCVKGSGWDMDSIEPEGLPAVKLDALKRLVDLEMLSDENMVRYINTNLIDPNSPTPSVETLSHAFLPSKYVFHSHASAILSVTNQPNGEQVCRDIFGDKLGIVPYIMPGFGLAKTSIKVYRENSDVNGLILANHGIFTFSDDPLEAYSSMIESVVRIEEYLKDKKKNVFQSANIVYSSLKAAELGPIFRGVFKETISHSPEQQDDLRFIITYRTSDIISEYVNGSELARYSQQGVTTPDHVIRTKNLPLILQVDSSSSASMEALVRDAVMDYVKQYEQYFDRQCKSKKVTKEKLDSIPRVILVPGLGIYGVGRNYKEAGISADIAENTIQTIMKAESFGTYKTLSEGDVFDVEYWSLEQAKIKKSIKPLGGKVVMVTGGAGTIGLATAIAFKQQGAEVVISDVNESDSERVSSVLGEDVLFVSCDVTNQAQVSDAFDTVCRCYGGIDILVSNAGAIYQGLMNDLELSVLRDSFEVNFFSHHNVSQNAIKIMKKQGLGGVVLFNVSKQAVNPGHGMGPYGLPKAATLSLVRQLALENGEFGIRVNGVNADRIRGGLLTDEVIQKRAVARGVSKEEYMSGNLLRTEVYADDVAQAFVQLAMLEKTTASIATVDGGNIEAALR